MALQGNLREFSLSDILQLVSFQRKTGLLTMRNPDDKVILGFDEGKLVSAESSAKRMDTRLGSLLVKTSCLSPELLSRALEIQAQTLQRLGFILLKNGFCTTDDLRSGLDIQIRKIAFSLFRWTDGDYIFDAQDQVDYDREFVSPIGVESLLMEGARMMDEWPIIEKVIRSQQMVFQRVPVGQRIVPAEEDEEAEEIGEATLSRRAKEGSDEPIKISRQEWPVYELVDGQRTVGAIIDRTFLSEFDGSKAFFDLVSRGLIAETRPILTAGKGGAGSHTNELRLIRKKQTGGTAVMVLGGVALLILLLVGVGAQSKNPLNIWVYPPKKIPLVSSLGKSLSLRRLRRLSEAVDTFYLGRGRFPESLEDVEAGRLVKPGDLIDPWGRQYRFVVQQDVGKYFLIGFDPDGKTDPDLFISEQLKGSNRASDPLVRTHSAKEVIVVR
jgi:hypothetical protein